MSWWGDQPLQSSPRPASLGERRALPPDEPDFIEKPTDVRIEHPVHLLPRQPYPERIQRIVLATPRPEAVGEAQEVDF